jgi:hypothetical protein
MKYPLKYIQTGIFVVITDEKPDIIFMGISKNQGFPFY